MYMMHIDDGDLVIDPVNHPKKIGLVIRVDLAPEKPVIIARAYILWPTGMECYENYNLDDVYPIKKC